MLQAQSLHSHKVEDHDEAELKGPTTPSNKRKLADLSPSPIPRQDIDEREEEQPMLVDSITEDSVISVPSPKRARRKIMPSLGTVGTLGVGAMAAWLGLAYL